MLAYYDRSPLHASVLSCLYFQYPGMNTPMAVHAIIISKRNSKLAAGQIHPFHQYAALLEHALGFTFEEVGIDDRDDNRVLSEIEYSAYDVVFVQECVLPSVGYIELLKSIPISIVILDSGGNIPFTAELLPHVSLYVKKQVYADYGNYSVSFWDGRYFTDRLISYYSGRMAVDKSFLSKHGEPSSMEIASESEMKKLVCGWNTATLAHLEERFAKQEYTAPLLGNKDIDVSSRLALTTEGAHTGKSWSRWYYFHRQECLEIAKSLGDEFSVVSEGYFHKAANNTEFFECGFEYRTTGSTGKLSIKRHLDELVRTKISISPFGMAEICIRDFEAVISGALLVKPDMSHVVTTPDIYRPFETYIPVKWDLSDLQEKVKYYLKNVNERNEIVMNAVGVYADYFNKNQFSGSMREVLSRLKGV